MQRTAWRQHKFLGISAVNSFPVVFTNHLLQLTAIQRKYAFWRWDLDMMFVEMSSLFYWKVVDGFADLLKDERVKRAVLECSQEDGLSARKAAKIYQIAPSTINRQLNEQIDSRRAVSQSQQLLTPVEEDTIVKWAIQYYKRGLPLGIRHLRQFATELLLRKQRQSGTNGSVTRIGVQWHQRLLSRNPEIKRVVARSLDRARAAAMLKTEHFEQFFELFDSLVQSTK
jgi:transposase